MAHAIGCIGSSVDLRTKAKPTMSREQRVKNNALVPRRVRNQTRKVAFVAIKRDGEPTKVRAILHGHAHHYQAAYLFAEVDVVKHEGKPLVIPASKLTKEARRKVVRRPA
jgi:hypothetical protein